MNKPLKASLLSAFLFPGAGHWWLKKYIAAVVFAVIAALPLYYIIDVTITQTQLIVDQVMLFGGNIDLLNINQLVTQQVASIDTQNMHLATIVLLCVWIVNILDAIRLARKLGPE
ncbi:hypothetical protein [Moritella viscosa]|uniref:Uncharacterized protein n=1 Tax=Moritella viscosa TaxID=80854 RepID=A0A1L0ACA3_9GAMM|nr:hypothetical protein [Moritella viscosa]SGZ12392.1 Putative uncharacterized protein [Moritella viscosa]SHO12818.1 Putative uncharacterized protein [Moritella viscosa]SHO12822.1 Putative uncharacterized protein [Moritella viscosa]SHO16757.1 Putative uncharacterized protein [Moritella viscosa]SHO18485.1 Putative uncharacterized protein [Moritella viscosa]